MKLGTSRALKKLDLGKSHMGLGPGPRKDSFLWLEIELSLSLRDEGSNVVSFEPAVWVLD